MGEVWAALLVVGSLAAAFVAGAIWAWATRPWEES